MSLGNKIVATIAGALTGVPASDVQNLMEGDPRNLHEDARKVLGLEVRDVAMIRNIKRMTPTMWSLQYLGIPRRIYEEYQQSLRKQAKEGKEEYPEIKLQAETDKIKENMPQIDGYLNFYQYLITTCQPVFKHTAKWRYIPAALHIEVAKDILEGILAKNSLTLLDVFRVSMYLYYGVFNAITGIKVDKTLQQSA